MKVCSVARTFINLKMVYLAGFVCDIGNSLSRDRYTENEERNEDKIG